MRGLLAYGSYLPAHRLARADIRSVLGQGGGKGTRSVASFDEDVSTLAVEAARRALAATASRPARLYFATSSPPYLEKTNAAVVHAALNLERSTLAVDLGGAVRSSVGALLAAADASAPTLVAMAEIRTGRPGGADETEGGDAAAALLFGEETADSPVIAEVIGSASTTAEFLERWRLPGAESTRIWEERFGEHVYGPLVDESFAAALKVADLSPDQVDHYLVCGLSGRAVKAAARSAGVRREAVARDLTDTVGNSGGAQVGLLLADALDRAAPGDTIVLTQLADGATTICLRATEALSRHRPAQSVVEQAGHAGRPVAYATFLSWRGFLDREPPRRPEPDAPAAPPSYRSAGFKFGFTATRCDVCGSVNLPPSRVCYACNAVNQMTELAVHDRLGSVVTFTVDRLAFTPSPPMVAVVVDLDGGGRFRCELADAGPEDVRIGMRVALTFRLLGTNNGVHNYFWKVRPTTMETR